LLVLTLVFAACAQVLGIRPADRKAFPHHAHTNKGVNCMTCHEGITSATDTGPLHIPGVDKCVTCHTKPHDPRNCRQCHGLDYVREEAALAQETLKFQHKKHLPRMKGQCVMCHQGVQRDADHIRPSMGVCLTCHQHQDDFFESRNCDRCHKDLPGEHVKPSSHVIHEGDWLREHGTRAATARDLCSTCHADKFCASCHGRTVPMLPERMAFDDPMRAGVHRAGFRSRHSLEARTQAGLCQTCHTPQTCESCHQENHVDVSSGGRSPHPKGWLGLRGESNEHGRAAWRDPSTCAACHTGAGEQMCIGCHRVGGTGGNPHRAGWTSKLRPTVDQPCRQCHGGGP
jgi:hypothetical protein